MFKFERLKGSSADRDEDVIYVASEVTDQNSILDVTYSQWSREFTLDDTKPGGGVEFEKAPSRLRVVWKPIYKFNSARVAMIAVMTLLNRGYTMTRVDAEEKE